MTHGSLLALGMVVATVFLLLLIGEVIARYNSKAPELNRKFVHMTVGSYVAFWPLILTWNQIVLISMAFVAVVGISKYFRFFHAIHGVRRATWGEVFFGAIVGLIAFVTNDGWIYMTALLHMSLADGMAAVVGTKFGKFNQYSVFGSTKSIVGTLTFFIVSFALLIVYSLGQNVEIAFAPLVALAAAAALLENGGVFGTDNLTVPLVVAVTLSTLS